MSIVGMKSSADFAPQERNGNAPADPAPVVRAELTGFATGTVRAAPRIDGGKAPFAYALSGDDGLSVDVFGRIVGTSSGGPVTYTVMDALGRVASIVFTPGSGVSPPVIRLPFTGVNIAPINFNHGSSDCAWINVIHSLQGWDPRFASDNTTPVQGPTYIGADGMPVKTNGTNGVSTTFVAFNNSAINPGCETDYVLVTSRTGWNPSIRGVNVTQRSTPTVNGKQVDRVEFSVAGATLTDGTYRLLTMSNVDALPWRDGQDFIYICRKSDEAKHLAGRYFTDRILAMWAAAGGGLRFMDVTETNTGGAITDMSGWTKLSNVFWGPGEAQLTVNRWPIEVVCAAPKEMLALYPNTHAAMELNIPYMFSPTGVRQLVRAVNANCPASVPKLPEYSNEVWNFTFPTFGYSQSHGPTPAITGLIEGDPSIANSAYRSALLMATLLDEDGYSGSWLPVLGTHAASPDRTHDGIVGVKAWMTNIATSGNADYNPTFAARYSPSKPIGQLFPFLTPANYMGIDLLTSGNQPTIKSWQNATDDSGLTAAFSELYKLDQLPTHNPAGINNLTAYYAQHLAYAQAENMGVIAYEGGYSQEQYGSSEAAFLGYRMEHDAVRGRKAQLDTIKGSFAAGFMLTFNYFDCNAGFTATPARVAANQGGYQYGLLDDLFNQNTPRWLAQLDAVANPPSLRTLEITTVTSGAYTTGKAPVTTAFIKGGQAPYKLAWKDLALGRSSDGAFTVSGALTTVGNVLGSVTVTDATGKTATATFAQNVAAPAAGYRFVMVKPISTFQYARTDGGARVGSSENIGRLADGTATTPASPRAVTGSVTGGNGPERLCDGSTSSSYITSGGGNAQPDGGAWIYDMGDGSAAKPATWDVYGCAEVGQFSPASLTILVATDPGLGAAPTYDQIKAAATFVQVANFPPSGPNNDSPNANANYTPDMTSGYWRVPLTYPSS